jgi:hypothetical protein
MGPESLHSLSLAAVFVGLFVAALGGFGTMHFGREAERAEEGERLQVIQSLSDNVGLLELEQSGLRERIAVMEKELVAPSHHGVPVSAPATPAPAAPPAVTPPPIAVTPPPVAEGPANVEKSDPLEVLSEAKAAVAKSPTLGAQQRATLVKRLSAHPNHRLSIQATEGDPQALELASALEAAFREARWKVQGVEIVKHHPPSSGLSLSTGVFPPSEEFITAYSALERAGFLVTSNLEPGQNGQEVVLFVGPKH